MDGMEHVGIVGTGLAGVRAAAELRAAGFTGKLTAWDAEDREPYDRPSLTKSLFGETGGVCVDTYSYEARVTGMLPPVHAVYINANYMTENLTTALKIISRVYKRGYVGFITGPSRTADIERVLTLGVHGPSRFFVIAIENMEGSEG